MAETTICFFIYSFFLGIVINFFTEHLITQPKVTFSNLSYSENGVKLSSGL